MTYKCINPKYYRIFSSLFSLQKHLDAGCSFQIHQLQDSDNKDDNSSHYRRL